MMRAFLSADHSVRNVMGASAVDAHGAIQATYEARTIIAEAEPDTSGLAGCLQSHAYSAVALRRGVRAGSLVANAREALAESLAAFVALDSL